jgi:tRNA threonylcarbamoyladenosine biosynthesis protein TsaB
VELAIDTASELVSIGLSREGQLMAEITWLCRRNHTVELLPSIERLLAQGSVGKGDLSAIFVCLGPGTYTGLRVGISTVQGLAYALRLPVVGVGRLELDAYPHAAFPGPIVPVHRAGRGELAWALYRGGPWREVCAPRLSTPAALARHLRRRTLVVGEVDEGLASFLTEATGGKATVAPAAARVRRAAGLAELGFARLQAGGATSPALLRPLYLRPPAVSPPRGGH